MRTGPDPARVAQIVAAGVRASGYLVRSRTVLTAAHAVQPQERLKVRFVAEDGGEVIEQGEVVFHEPSLDIAVVTLAGGPKVDPVPYGRVVDPLPAEAIGFPRFRLHTHQGAIFRDTRHARGVVAPASWRREGGLELIVDAPAPDPEASPWEGMSGAAIWSVGHVIGVVSEHRLNDPPDTLTGTRVDRWYGDPKLSRGRLKRLRDLIGLPAEHGRLTTVTAHVWHLEAYLDAATHALRQPTGAPAIDSYVPQTLHRHGVDNLLDIRAGQGRITSEDLLATTTGAIVTAGPGGGKSSLLRALQAAGIARWRGAHPPGELPVYVQATDLVGGAPLAQALAGAVSARLSAHGLTARLPDEFFQAPPRPGGRWLLLVDGLDDIIDPEGRAHVLRLLSAARDYRFILCTRPLADRRETGLRQGTARYELEPFARHQIHEFACRWFTAAGGEDPSATADALALAATRAGLIDLMRVPLMAALLCHLYAVAPDAPLPSGRSGVISRFVESQSERFHSPGAGGAFSQAKATFERYGPDVVTAAGRAVALMPAVVREMAVRQHNAGVVAVNAFLAAHPKLAPPAPVPHEAWSSFLADTARRTGLLVGEPAAFFHGSIAEYFAAQELAADAARHEAVLRDGLAAVRRRTRAARYLSVPAPAPEASFLGFLIDARKPSRSAHGVLKDLASGTYVQGPEFIAELVRLGTKVPPDVVRRATDNLRRTVGRKKRYTPSDRARAAVALAELSTDEGEELMLSLASDTDLPASALMDGRDKDDAEHAGLLRGRYEYPRVYLALKLAERGRPAGYVLLNAMARDAYLLPMTRAHSAGALADLGSPGAAELLHDLAHDPTMTVSGRIVAARLLGLKLADERAARILNAIARDDSLSPFVVSRAAFSLARLGDNRGRTILLRIARTAPPDGGLMAHFARVQAARFLARLGDERALKVFERLAHDEDVPTFVRRRAKSGRKRFAAMKQAAMTVEQRVIAEIASVGVAARFVNAFLTPIANVAVHAFLRRYRDARPADADP
ncbi:trypsin-like peptidase domain-containing protein [Luedemannella helvata]|uniref:NACHT domain-containing protein n=1 Tax=Luedemannella helvata TaxID=349315 RepID=A0ABN2KIP1_9ACTN